ncbi:hypothetical protein FRC09_015783 [Ceratobasidium sp. 395]|nr:hypothetical protein FRC09_015783 [Ceratobasidium sp. 395]
MSESPATPNQRFSLIASKTPQSISLKYELPALLRSTQSGWISTFQASATVGALFAALEGQLLVFVKGIDPEKEVNHASAGYQALVALTYAAFFFSISATVSALILTDECTELNSRAASKKSEELKMYEDVKVQLTIEEILERYGMKRSCQRVRAHCTCNCI